MAAIVFDPRTVAAQVADVRSEAHAAFTAAAALGAVPANAKHYGEARDAIRELDTRNPVVDFRNWASAAQGAAESLDGMKADTAALRAAIGTLRSAVPSDFWPGSQESWVAKNAKVLVVGGGVGLGLLALAAMKSSMATPSYSLSGMKRSKRSAAAADRRRCKVETTTRTAYKACLRQRRLARTKGR